MRSSTRLCEFLIAGPGDRLKISALLKEMRGVQPPLAILMVGVGGIYPAIADDLQRLSGLKFQTKLDTGEFFEAHTSSLTVPEIFIGDLRATFPILQPEMRERRVSVLVLGRLSEQYLKIDSRLAGVSDSCRRSRAD